VLVLFGSLHLTIDIAALVAVLFIGSLVSLVIGLAYFLVDIFASLRAMQAELEAARPAPGGGGGQRGAE
jgi:hypothetical protein